MCVLFLCHASPGETWLRVSKVEKNEAPLSYKRLRHKQKCSERIDCLYICLENNGRKVSGVNYRHHMSEAGTHSRASVFL